jgi:hypothetical protein
MKSQGIKHLRVTKAGTLFSQGIEHLGFTSLALTTQERKDGKTAYVCKHVDQTVLRTSGNMLPPSKYKLASAFRLKLGINALPNSISDYPNQKPVP